MHEHPEQSRPPREGTARPPRLAGALLAVAFTLASLPLLTGFGSPEDGIHPWSKDERAVLSSLTLATLPPVPHDPSNAAADKPAAVALGKRLFADARLSRNGAVS